MIFSRKRSSVRDAIHRRLLTRAIFVCLLKVNFWEFLLFRLCQSSSQFANSRKNRFFVIFTCYFTYPKVCIEFLFAVIYFPPDINEFQKRRSIQPIWVIAFYGCRCTLIKIWSRGTLRSTGTLCLLSPGCIALFNNLVGFFFALAGNFSSLP